MCFHLFGVYTEIIDMLGHTVTLFNCLRNCQPVFLSGRTVFHSLYESLYTGLISPRLQGLLFGLLIPAIPVGVNRYLTVSICISLVTDDLEHFLGAYWPFVYLSWTSVG